ncbi:MAG: tyrosine-protein phosphatase [Bacteroidales bacterium]|nr:tyrosine-protein phosphatase [Bacteroidales bacterium]
MRRRLYKSLLIALALFSATAAKGQMVPRMVIIENDILRQYLDNSEYDINDYTYTNITAVMPERYGRWDKPEPVVFHWEFTPFWNEVVLEIRENEFDPVPAYAITVSPGVRSCSIYNLIPGRRYYYSVVDLFANTEYEKGNFFVEGRRRFIKADYVRNIRDMGGMVTDDSRTLKYGRLYRGAALDNARGGYRDTLFNRDGWRVLHDELRITADVDLRSARELLLTDDYPGNDMDQSPLGADVGHYHFPISDFGAIYVSNMYGPVIACIVERLRRGDNVYFHCAQGADRTGVLAFLLGGMAGVCENDLARDYELTCLSVGRMSHTRCSMPPYNYAPSVQYIKENFNGNTLSEKIQDYLIKKHGVTREQINTFRRIMVGD